MSNNIVTCVAPVNIAVIKYWGKRNEKLILPLNDSVSATLSLDQMQAKTTIMTSPHFKDDKMWLNGKEETFDNPRLQNCLQEIRKRAQRTNGHGDADGLCSWHVHVCSENNFPTAAGLASSAAGYACLVFALSKLFDIRGDISAITRLGSGSACRSVFGGFVQWHRGTAADGSDSLATQIAPANHWPELRVMILVVNDKQKKTSSTSGMQRSVQTSELLKTRVEKCVPERTAAIVKAIHERDFSTFAEITMKDSNQFHAVCLDTYPPAVYMNDVSHSIVSLIHSYNDFFGQNKVAYTFDAGPNACLYLLESELPQVSALINYVFPPTNNVSVEYHRGIAVDHGTSLSKELITRMSMTPEEPGLLKYIIHTKVGDGPRVVPASEEHLLNEAGLPKRLI